MSASPVVDRCVCMNVTFEHLIEYARVNQVDFAALQRRFNCGRGCGLCVPYLQHALESGCPAVPLDAVMRTKS